MIRSGGAAAFRIGSLALGFTFLYAPIALLAIYSFNASRLVAVWAGFSTRWYGVLGADDQFRNAAATSLEVAAMAASLALVVGTFAGFAMARFTRFHGRRVFGFAVLAPLVVPEIILGLSLLLFFVACEALIGWPPGRGEQAPASGQQPAAGYRDQDDDAQRARQEAWNQKQNSAKPRRQSPAPR